MRTKRRWSQNWARALVLSIFVVMAVLFFVAAWRWFAEPAGTQAPARAALEFPAFKCRYLKPTLPWEPDTTVIKQRLKALLVMQRRAPQAWLALLGKDYKDQPLGDSDLRDEAIRRLGGYFQEDNLEWKQTEDAELAGRRALRLVFRGEAANKPLSGECYCLAHQGIAYWFLTWAPADQAASLAEEFEDLRRRFSLLHDQKGQAERRPATQIFRGRGIPYTLQDGAGRWQEWTPATDYDTRADLALVAGEGTKREAGEGPQPAVAASVVVLVLKGRQENLDDAIRAAKAHLEAEQKVAYPETAVETVVDKVQTPESSERIGNASGRIVRLHVRNGETRHRFVLLGAIPLRDQLLVLQCESAWNRRATWEPLFRRLLSSLRLAENG